MRTLGPRRACAEDLRSARALSCCAAQSLEANQAEKRRYLNHFCGNATFYKIDVWSVTMLLSLLRHNKPKQLGRWSWGSQRSSVARPTDWRAPNAVSW